MDLDSESFRAGGGERMKLTAPSLGVDSCTGRWAVSLIPRAWGSTGTWGAARVEFSPVYIIWTDVPLISGELFHQCVT